MAKYLSKLYRPNEILISWQNINRDCNAPGGRRVIIGKLKYITNEIWNLEYFNIDEIPNFVGYLPYRFCANKLYENVKSAFIKRLPPKTRGDFADYLIDNNISKECIDIDEFTLLAYTSGRIHGDNFTFINPLDTIPIGSEFIIDIAGFSHYNGMKNLNSLLNQEVFFIKEPQNVVDNNAIRIETKDLLLGYVNKGQANYINKLLDRNITIKAIINTIKGDENKPIVSVYVKI